MVEVKVSEIIPVVVDPTSTFFGREGVMRAYDRETGDGYYTFDGPDQAIRLNEGNITGLPQVIRFGKDQQREAERLKEALPRLRVRLEELHSQIVDPERYIPTPETIAAKIGFTALIKEVTVAQV